MTGFSGHNCDFYGFSALYMGFLLCLNFSFYGSLGLVICFEYSLEVVWGGGVGILGVAPVWYLYCYFEI